ncbi:hypothetical protein BDZ97DRAFT_1924972 [Flammula alnicola]|nr:hypothetical protein BDZ97DRAFT_1924972 [Flammula alnicola]
MANVVAAASAAAGGASRRPPALTMPFTSDNHHARHLSTTSSASSSSDDEPESSALSALDSSAALILVHDQDEPSSPFDFTDDEDDRDDDPDLVSPIFEVRKSAVFPPLPPSLVFLYLLTPYLKLGALDLPNSQLPLKYGLPALLLSALASGFARQIWYMLARYLRKADMTDILLDTFAKGRGKERQRAVIRAMVRVGTGVISTLLAVTYLRHSMYTLHSLLPQKQQPILAYLASTSLIGLVVAYPSYARSLSSKRIVYATWLSIATYTAWLGCTIYAHTHGLLEVQTGWLGAGSIWQGLSTTAFAFCSSSTLPLYASLKGTSPIISTGKTPRSRSFRIISFLSVVSAILFLLPSVIFAAFPNQPAVVVPPTSLPADNTTATTIIPVILASSSISLNVTHIPVLGSIPSLAPPLPSEIALPVIQIQTVRRILASTTVLLGIPTLIVTTPPIAHPSLRSVKFNVSRVIIIFLVLVLAMIPPRSFPSPGEGGEGGTPDDYYLNSSAIFAVLTAVMVLMTFASTYFLPALLHILTHIFKRPLAIVVPPRTPLLQTPSTSVDFENAQSGSGSRQTSPRTVYDELLLRKERALQKKQFKKRIVWDIGVWLLLGASATGVVIVAGGFAGTW